MKDKDKYYTPSIEEFHVGFECETNNVSVEKKKAVNWDKLIVTRKTLEMVLYDLSETCTERHIRNAAYRVKYLDKEDIESLGYKYIGGKSPMRFVKGSVNIDFFTNTSVMYINYLKIQKLFEGTLKNKSELTSQLKRCGIEI